MRAGAAESVPLGLRAWQEGLTVVDLDPLPVGALGLVVTEQLRRPLPRPVPADHRHARLQADFGAIHHCRQLRHADACDDPGGADGPGTDPDLHAVGTGIADDKAIYSYIP